MIKSESMFAVVYADGAGKVTTEEQFEEFQLVLNQLNLMLRINAVSPVARLVLLKK